MDVLRVLNIDQLKALCVCLKNRANTEFDIQAENMDCKYVWTGGRMPTCDADSGVGKNLCSRISEQKMSDSCLLERAFRMQTTGMLKKPPQSLPCSVRSPHLLANAKTA